MTTKEYAQYYGLKENTVRKYCNKGKINANKVNTRWEVSIESVPPLSSKRIRLILISLLLYKNNTPAVPDFSISNCNNMTIPYVLKSLSDAGYVLGFDINNNLKLILKNTYISNEGLNFLFSNKKYEIDWIGMLIKYSPEIINAIVKLSIYLGGK